MRHLPIPRAGFGCARAPVLSALLLMFGLCAGLTAAAALPLTWRADWPDCKPVESLVHRGTDVELQPTWYVNGAAAATNGWTFTTYVQTNAVGQWFGPLPGTVFSHTNDVGAAFYNVMVRAQGADGGVNYTAFARFRMLDSPGFTPGELPLPAKVIDFADVTVLNPPWSVDASITNGFVTAAAATNIAEAVAASATNALDVSLSSRLSHESHNSTNYTDSAIAAATNDLASASSLTNFATRAELEAGWWSEWVLTGNLPVDAEIEPSTSSSPNPVCYPDPDHWQLDVLYNGDVKVGYCPGTEDDDRLEFEFDEESGLSAYTVIATRHRIAAPVPTKPSDIGAASTNDVMLTPQLSEWTFSSQPSGEGHYYTLVWQDVNNGLWILFESYDGDMIDVETTGGFEDATSVSFSNVGVTATRTVIGYTLGSQTNKLLQAAGDYAQASVLADIAETATNALETADAAAAAISTNSANIATLNAQVASATNALNVSLSSRLSQSSLASTNYTDSAIASADTSYARFVTLTNVNQSVQFVTLSASDTTLSIELPEAGETKDWIVYVLAATNTTLILPPATWYMTDTANTNAIPAGMTAFYFSQMATGIYMLGRQELEPVTIQGN